MSISWTLLDIINNDLLGPVWQSLTCYCFSCRSRRRRRRRRRRRSSRFRPCLPLSVVGVFQFLSWFPLYYSILVSLV
jgi:hypothetical protein